MFMWIPKRGLRNRINYICIHVSVKKYLLSTSYLTSSGCYYFYSNKWVLFYTDTRNNTRNNNKTTKKTSWKKKVISVSFFYRVTKKFTFFQDSKNNYKTVKSGGWCKKTQKVEIIIDLQVIKSKKTPLYFLEGVRMKSSI